MRAVKLRAPSNLGNIGVSEIADPGAPKAGEVRVRLHASSLNYHDYAVVTGGIPTPDGRIPMSDGAGVVEAAGEGVSEFAAGDAVVSCFFPMWQDGVAPHGNFAFVPGDGLDGYAREVIVTPVTWFTRAPKGWSHTEAATLPCAALTAWRGLVVDGGLKAGDNVLVLGTGGVAIFALQFAKAMGATVILLSSSDAKIEKARALGADHTINYRSVPKWSETVRRLTDGRGADHVLEIGGPGTLAQSIAATRVGGHISLIGTLTGSKGEVPTLLLMARQIRLNGIIVGSRRQQQEMVRALDATGIRPAIDRAFPLASLGDAFRHEEGATHFGKICVEI